MRIIPLVLILTACDLKYEPDVGSISPDATSADGELEVSTNAKCADSDPMTPVSFTAQIRPLLARSPGACTGCHGASATSGFNVSTYQTIRSGGQISGTKIIEPGKPCESILLQKLGPAPAFGARMPYSGPPFYSATDLGLVRDWIAEGALDN
jgi:hypothetical protein